MTEWDISLEIEFFFRRNGCTKSSFDSIVASGAGSSMPHYETSMTKKIRNGDVLLIDMGCTYQGYNSDLTRTLFIGSIDPFMKTIYGIVRRAQEAACASVRPGITTGELDSVAREIISHKGFGPNFGHSLGHGLGLEVHEGPRLSPKSETVLEPGMVTTVEPGIYVPDFGGVRIEDVVIIREKGCEVLTRARRDLIEL